MWNARKAQLELELGDRHHLAQRSRPRGPSPGAAGRQGDATAPQAGKRRRVAHSNGSAGRNQARQRSDSGEQSGSGGEGSLSEASVGGEISQHPKAAAEAERQLEELLSKSRVRGRGAVGPRADEPGPYLPASAAGVCVPVEVYPLNASADPQSKLR